MPQCVKPAASVHPVLFLILFLPMGMANGYVVVTLGYLLSKAGVSVDAIATLVSLSLLPQTWKFIGAPLVDATLDNKRWYVISAATGGLLIAATAFVPIVSANLLLFDALVFTFNVAVSFNAMAADSLMAYATTPEQKGRAGGWSQAGNLGGSGLGGGAALWLTQHVAMGWVAGAALGTMCILSSLALIFVKEPVSLHRAERLAESLLNVGRDVWSVARSPKGFLALAVLILPISVGAAQNLWAAVAGDWHASGDVVALVNGALGGVISMFGCVIGGWICDQMDRKTAINLFSVILALSAVAMALAPRTQEMFVVFTCLYAFIMGFCYAAFGAVALEAIGAGAAATKYNVLASVANLATIYLTKIEGWAQTRFGSTAMLWTEALVPIAGTCIFILIALATRRFFVAGPAAGARAKSY